MNGARTLNSVVLHPQAAKSKVKVEPATLVPGSLDYIDEFVTYQHGHRREPKKMVSAGAVTGAMFGGLVGAEVAICSGGIAAPVGIPVAVIGGALIGSAVGFFPEKYGVGSGSPDPDAFRLHTFEHMGVVPSRRDSKKIVSSLKKHGVFARGRRRTIVDVQSLNSALAGLKLRQGDLSADQCAAVACLVQTHASEVTRRARLFAQVQQLQDQIEKKRIFVVASGADLATNQDLLKLQEEKDGVMTEIARLPSDRTVEAVRATPAPALD